MTVRTIHFSTKLSKTGTNTTGVVVPDELLEKLGAGRRPAVVATINTYSYRTTVGIMRGYAMLPFSANHRDRSGISAGDAIEVELALDTESREVSIPADLAEALKGSGTLEKDFLKQSPSRQRADVEGVTSAKAPETRARRIAAIVARLKG